MSKKKKKNLYLGNNPNSANYDPNIPIGYNKWDELESWGDEDDDIAIEEIEDENDWRNFESKLPIH